MRRNCNLELRLFPVYDSDHHHPLEKESSEISTQQNCQQHQQQQKLTIFYDGKICVCDVTEFQARAILMFANKENEERLGTPITTPTGSEPCSPTLPSHRPLYSPSTGLSMKRSLQRFLQKRKNRLQEASPYHGYHV